jgi:hypothetical protein
VFNVLDKHRAGSERIASDGEVDNKRLILLH